MRGVTSVGKLSAKVVGLVLAFGASEASAITINDLAGSQMSRALAAPFNSVLKVLFKSGSGTSLCSGALISPTAVLTADHCARGKSAAGTTVQFTNGDSGATRLTRQVSSISTFGPPSTGSGLLNGTDLAVLRLSSAVTDRLPFLLFDGPVVGSMGRMVGYGMSGVGSTGLAGGAGSQRLAADNVIDWHGEAKYCGSVNSFCSRDGTYNILSADFDRPEGTANRLAGPVIGSSPTMTMFEGATAPGDSGGPLLVLRDNMWMIAGVATGGSAWNSNYGAVSWWTGVGAGGARSFLESEGGKFHNSFQHNVFALSTARRMNGRSALPMVSFAAAEVPVPGAGLLLLSALGLGAVGFGRRTRRKTEI